MKKIFFSSLIVALSCSMLAGSIPANAADKPPMGKITPDRTRLWSPGRLAVDSDGIIYVVDSYKNRVQEFDAKGTPLGSISVSRPSAVAVSPDGRIYIGSHDGYDVAIYKRGDLTGYLGAGKNEFASISDIAVDKSTGDVYVVDTKENAVKVYYSTGTLKGKLGGFTAPIAAAVTGTEVLVLDAPAVKCPGTIMVKGKSRPCPECTGPCSGSRITVLDNNGTPVRNLTESGKTNDTMVRPIDIAADALGNIYVADSLRNAILVYDKTLTLIGEFVGSQDDLHMPVSLALSSDNSLYASSSQTRSIVEIGLAGKLHTTSAASLNFQTRSGAPIALGVLGY